MNSPLSVGLVGIGGFGRQHLSTLSALQSGGQCRLAAIADPYAPQHASVVAALRAENVAIYDDIAQLLTDDKIEACFIATPIPLHVPHALAVLRAGKHVYLEKPPCVTLEEWKQLSAAEAHSGKRITVGFQMQTAPAIHFLKASLIAGAIGRLQSVSVSARWRRDDAYYARSPWAGCWMTEGRPVFDGPATNAISHAVHGALFLSGDAAASWGQLQRVRGRLRRARPIESYDAAFLEAQTASGVLVRLAFIHATPEQDRVVLTCVGDNGRADLGWDGSVRIAVTHKNPQQFNFPCEAHAAAALDFLRAVRDPAHRPFTRLEDCLPYLQTVNGALQSSGGAQAFESSLVRRHETETGRGGYYTVDGLDEELAAFAADPAATPSLLAPGEWIEISDLAEQLTLPHHTS
jgi:predicted dehydrogenase